MRHHFFDIAFTPAVQAEQHRHGSRASYAAEVDSILDGAYAEILSQREKDFVAARDSFYMATVSETGWPYVQHRGGPPGFIRCLNNGSLGWAEFIGNRQYISIGNTTVNDRVAIIFMDYPHRRRLKILGHLSIHDAADRPDLALQLSVDGYRARVEQFVVVTIDAFDWNCPQHITPRYTVAEVERLAAPLHARIADLEARIAKPVLVSDCGLPPR